MGSGRLQRSGREPGDEYNQRWNCVSGQDQQGDGSRTEEEVARDGCPIRRLDLPRWLRIQPVSPPRTMKPQPRQDEYLR